MHSSTFRENELVFLRQQHQTAVEALSRLETEMVSLTGKEAQLAEKLIKACCSIFSYSLR